MRKGARYFKPDSRDPKKLVETDKNYCLSDFCRNIVHRKNAHSPYCSKCRNRRWREKFPLHYSFKNLRVRAKQRGKDFSLTLQEYIKFAIQTDYASMKGRTSMSLTINRIDNSRGYHADNIESITKSENSRKLSRHLTGSFQPLTIALSTKKLHKIFQNIKTDEAKIFYVDEISVIKIESGDLSVLTTPMRIA